MQNVDKIAIIAAAVIILGGIGWAVTREDAGAKFTEEINASVSEVEEKISDQKVRLNPPLAVQESVQQDFQVSEASEVAPWTFYRRPALAVLFTPEVKEPPVHTAPRLTAVEIVRDAEAVRAIHLLRGVQGSIERAEYVERVVEMKSAEGEWQDAGVTIPTGEEGSEFEIRVTDLAPMGRYEYRLRTVAKSTVAVGFADGAETQTSNASEPVFMPPNEDWRVTSATPSGINQGNGKIEPGTANIRRLRWDYNKGKAVAEQGVFTEAVDASSWRELKDIFRSGYRLRRVKETKVENRRTVVVHLEDPQRKLEKLELVRGVEGVDLNPQGWTAPDIEEPEPDLVDPEPKKEEKKPKEEKKGGIFDD